MNDSILVTGAGGYIGSLLVHHLLNLGYTVTATDRFSKGQERQFPSHSNLIVLKCPAEALSQDQLQGIGTVIDLAAISNLAECESNPQQTYNTNYITRLQTAMLAKQNKVQRYIFPSSCIVYDMENPDTYCDESSPIAPRTAYALANAAAEKSILSLCNNHFTVVVPRIGVVYGWSPVMRYDLAINAMTIGAQRDALIRVRGDGTQWRPFIHIEDVIDFFCLCLESSQEQISGEIFNIGMNENNHRLIDVAREIQSVVNSNAAISHYGENDLSSFKVSFDKVQSRLNWKAQRTISDGARGLLQRVKEVND